MNEKQIRQTSKKMSYVLRHAPESMSIVLEPGGWASVEDLLAGFAKQGRALTSEQLEQVVFENDKKRFEFSEDGKRIRARQGHSTDVDLQYKSVQPPDVLYQGTATRFLDSIFEQGLLKQARHHVHLSTNKQTLLQVGSRHGKPAILAIDARKMHEQGFEFFVTDNQVWLTDHVPPEFLRQVSLDEIELDEPN